MQGDGQGGGAVRSLSLDKENYSVDKMSDTMATYLTGAIHVLRKDYDKATKHLSRIISNQALRTSAAFRDGARYVAGNQGSESESLTRWKQKVKPAENLSLCGLSY